MAVDEYYATLHHEAASKFLNQGPVSAKYSAIAVCPLMDFSGLIRFNAGGAFVTS